SFSSRRRHTRCYRDWSSDVCSSDLPPSIVSSAEAPSRSPAAAMRLSAVWPSKVMLSSAQAISTEPPLRKQLTEAARSLHPASSRSEERRGGEARLLRWLPHAGK